MKLTRLYSNRPEIFQPVEFNAGLSAVFAEIRIPENRQLDTHNLGKSIFGELIDFCLLKGKDPDYFLYRYPERFSEFAFLLEMEVGAGDFLTIRRSVDPGSKIDFKRSEVSLPDANDLNREEWDHLELPFEKANLLLDGILDFTALQPWGIRKLVGYLIRSQQDYRDVFQLGKFSGKHRDWKPFVAHLMGIPAQPVIDLYEKKDEIDRAGDQLRTLNQEWGADDIDPSLLDGLISVKRREVETKKKAMNAFNFAEEDRETIARLVDDIEVRIVALNDESYRLAQLMARLDASLEEHKVVFAPDAASELFAEAGVAFDGQIKRDFEQLLSFNRAITKERREALVKQRSDAKSRVAEIETQLEALNEERRKSLGFLRESDDLTKYKDLTQELASAQAELSTLEAKRVAASRLVELRREQRSLEEDFGHLQTTVENLVDAASKDETSRFAKIRGYFSEIVTEVVGEGAILAISTNSKGGLEFRAEFVRESGVATSEDRGTSYRKLLCIAFDLAVIRAYQGEKFPRFVYLDGALEQLDPRKQEKLVGVFRKYAASGLQPIVSLLDSDLPAPLGESSLTLSQKDIVLPLHDEGEDGRLFKMAGW
jgi:uncharacterized protein YydD (DUF2326 family)